MRAPVAQRNRAAGPMPALHRSSAGINPADGRRMIAGARIMAARIRQECNADGPSLARPTGASVRAINQAHLFARRPRRPARAAASATSRRPRHPDTPTRPLPAARGPRSMSSGAWRGRAARAQSGFIRPRAPVSLGAPPFKYIYIYSNEPPTAYPLWARRELVNRISARARRRLLCVGAQTSGVH